MARQAFPTRGDKAVSAQSIRGRMALEGLYLPSNRPWTTQFPCWQHDDQADALGLIGQLLDQMMPGERTRPQTPIKRDRYASSYEFREEEEEMNWKVL